MTCHPIRSRFASLSERGSAAVEYMFIAAVILIPLLVCMYLLEQQSGSVIVEGGNRAGTPAEYSEGVVVPP